MSVGGTVVDIVRCSPDRWWINTLDRHEMPQLKCTVAVYCDPKGEPIEVGDSLWWQGGSCYWTPQDRSRADVELRKIGYSGVAHPDAPRCPICGCTVEFCRKHGGCSAPSATPVLKDEGTKA